ncbi:MAG: hypothetical protein CME06_17140 [Gemmatimonadetes bacterium]|nr:hypothetical protein [Gemmatimonadota bacterium]
MEIRPLSIRDEALAVLRFLAVVYALLFLGVWGRSAKGGTAAALFPFQTRFRDLSPTDQRMFRQVGEGLVEALLLRSVEGEFPSAQTLRSDGVPPFAAHPLDDGAYRWTLDVDGNLIRYHGAATLNRNSFLIVIAEPDPRAPDPSHRAMRSIDSLHRRLDDGTILDVGIWMRAGPPPEPISALPMTQGWSQIVLAGDMR